MLPSDPIEPGFDPYTPPAAEPEVPRSNYRRVNSVRVGQRMVLVSILALVVFVVTVGALYPGRPNNISIADGVIVGALALAYVISSFVGYAKMLLGLNRTWFSTFILFACYFLPVIHWLVIYLVNSEASDFLRRCGLKVGLLGARRLAPPPRIER